MIVKAAEASQTPYYMLYSPTKAGKEGRKDEAMKISKKCICSMYSLSDSIKK